MVDPTDLLLGGAFPVLRLPRRAAEEEAIEVRFCALTKDICTWWDQNVQPAINAADPARADKGWKWPRLLLLQKLSTSRRQCTGAALVMKIPGSDGELPIGLTLLVTPYPHLSNHSKDASFLWFLSEIPSDIGVPKEIALPKRIGSALLDYSLVVSFAHELHGRVGLHAAPEGGPRLSDWYSSRKMVSLSAEVALPGLRGVVLRNDGRYFMYEPKGSIEAFGLMSDWR